ncbi:MAG TPA: hypothetical protein VLF40_02685 [Candidatus Saccharimonadales bacterium]|nr:hypothetical protein [Candidatus Saccharimonadales bacterium]
MAYVPPLNGGRINATISGNTAGAGALVSSGTLALAGGNNITLSQNGQSITISGGAAGGTNTLGMSNLGNTSGTTGVLTGSALNYQFAGGNNITLSQSLNGASGTLTISAANQSNQNISLFALGNTTQNSSTLLNASNLSLNGLGGATVGYSNGSIQISAPVAQTNQTGGVYASGANTIGQSSSSTYDARSLNISGQGALSAGWSGSTLQLSAPVQTNQTLGLYGVGNTTQNSSTTLDARTLSFNGLGPLSVGFSNGSIELSAPATSSLSVTGILSMSANGSTVSIGAPAFSAGISTQGNTAGNTSLVTNQLLLVGGNNITLSQTTGAGGATLSIVGANTAAQSNQTLSFSAGSQSTLTATGTFDARSLFINGVGNISAGFSQSSIFISGSQSAQTQSNIQGIIASGSTNRTGDISFQNSNGVTFGLSNNTVTASYTVPTQSNQTIGYYISGNTTGTAGGGSTSSNPDARSVTISAAGMISAGFSSNSMLVLSATQSVQTQSNIQGIIASGSTNRTGDISFANSNNITFGLSNNTVTASFAGGGGGVALYDGAASITSGTARFSNANGVSFGFNGQTITGSVSQTNQTVGLYALGNTTQNSSTTLDARTLSFNGLGGATVGYSNGSIQMSVPSASSVNAAGIINISSNAGNVTISAPAFSIGLSTTIGNTAGNTGTVSNQLILAGGNNITLSGSTTNTGATITISGPNQSNPNVSLYALGNTTQNSSTQLNVSNLSFNGLGDITVGYSNGSIQLSGTQTNQNVSLYALGNTTQNSSTLRNASNLSFNGLGNITVGYSNGSIQLSGAGASFSAGVSGGNTSNTSGTVNGQLVFAGGNNITLSQSNNGASATITVSAFNQSNQNISLYALGNTTQNSSTLLNASNLSLNGLGSVTVGYSNGSIQISGSQTNQNISLYALGNTTQNSSTLLNASNLSFNGLGMITAGYSNGSIQLSATQSNQNVSLYALGNTTQNSSTLLNASNLSFNGLGNVTVGYSNGSIQISGAGGGGGGVNIAASNTTFTSGTVVMSNNGGALTISSGAQSVLFSVAAQSQLSGTGALSLSTNGSTISIGVPATTSLSGTGGFQISSNGSTISMGMPYLAWWTHNSAALYSSSTSANLLITQVSVVRVVIPEQMSFTRVDIPVFVNASTIATSRTVAVALTAVGVLYSRNDSTLNAIVGQSSNNTYSYISNSGVISSITGPRLFSFNLATTVSAGEYYMGFQMSTKTFSSAGGTSTSGALSISPIYGVSATAAQLADMSVATTGSTINAYLPLQGLNTVSISNTSQTMQQSQITVNGISGQVGNMIVVFRNS